MKDYATHIRATSEKDKAGSRPRLIVVSKRNQKTGLASVAQTPDREQARRTREVGVPVCVVRWSETLVLRSETLRISALRVWMVVF